MRPLFWLLFLQGFLCHESPLKIHPNPLDGWEGLCMVIPCHISETLYSEELKPTAMVWYFNPVFDHRLLSYKGQLLYDSSKTSMELKNVTSPNFRDRVRFVGDLNRGDCTLMITELRTNDSGTYGVIVAASVAKTSRRQMLYHTVGAHIRESPPKPRIEMVDEETQEWWTKKVTCSVPYHCPDERMTLTFIGLEKNQQKMTIANGTIQIVATLETILKDKKNKTMTCLLISKDGSLRSKTTVELEGPSVMEESQWPHQTFHTAMKKVRVVDTAVGVQCYESPLSITLSSLAAWEGSCVRIACHIDEHNLPDKINITSLLWYFDPYIWHNNIDHLLYASSNASMNRTSPNFQGRVKFVGDLSKADCSLLVTRLQIKDNGWFRARAVLSLPNYPLPLTRLLSAMVNITELPPEPKIRTDPTEIHEGKPIKVICSALYHCPDENVTLTLAGLQKDRLSSQQTATENRMVQTVVSFRPTLEDHGKVLRCLYKSQAGGRRSKATMKLDVKFAPREVRAMQDPEEIIKMGLTLQLKCKVGKANPQKLTYAWYKNGKQLPLASASSPLLTIQKVGTDDTGLYHCEASNSVGTLGSLQVEIISLCSPSLPDDCFVKAWNP